MNPTKQLKGYKSERCMDCSHAEKISSCRIKCKIDRSIRWKDYTCGSFDYSEECYEQSTEQPEITAGEKTIGEIWKEWCEKDISWTDAASGAMSEYSSQQIAGKDQEITELTNLLSDTNKRIQEIQDEEELKDKQLQVQQSHIDDQDQLIFEQDKEIKELKAEVERLNHTIWNLERFGNRNNEMGEEID